MTDRRIRLGSALAAVLLALSLVWMPWLDLLDLKLLDHQFELLRKVRPRPATSVVLVGVDEASVKALPEPMVLWHHHLADLFRALSQAGVRGVGLDFNLADRSYDQILPGLDVDLMRGILALRRTAPLVLGVTVDSGLTPRPIHPPFLMAAGDQGSGLVLFPVDGDRYVRRFEEPRTRNGEVAPTLTGMLARSLGYAVPSGYLDFSLGPPMDYIPFSQVLAWHRAGQLQQLRAAFQGKVVFVGSVLPLVDRHFMPVNLAGWEENHQFAPGMLLHAQAMRCIQNGGFVRRVPWYFVLAAAGLGSLLAWCLGKWASLGLGLLGLCLGGILLAAHALLRIGFFLPVVAALTGAVLAFGLRMVVESWLQLRERRRLRQVFAGYVSPAILKEIVSGRIHPGLQGRRMSICLMFTDIRNFTRLSEGMASEDVISILNHYFNVMSEAIHRHGGTLDKFMGDGIMAFLGAPVPMEAPCRAAFATAQDMLTALEGLNRDWAGAPWLPLRIGIGLHFGEASVGHVGSESRHEYTAIGDVVNVASRVEGLTKECGYPLLVTSAFLETLRREGGETAAFDALGEHAIKGHAPIQIFGWPPRGRPSQEKET